MSLMPAMEPLLTALRACAEPTRLRLLALAARGAFCVVEFTEILGQSQPRLSRHLKLLCDAGVLERVREGANVWFAVPSGHSLVRDLLARLPETPEAIRTALRNNAGGHANHTMFWSIMGGKGGAPTGALLAAVDRDLGGMDAMRAAFDSVTTAPAAIMGLDGYGLRPGCHADFVLLQAADPIEALRHE